MASTKMSGVGRKPKPAALRLIEGTKASCPPVPPANLVESPPATDLTPPAYLNKYGMEMWNEEVSQLEDIGVIGSMDVRAFALLCQAYGEWRETDAAVQKLKQLDPGVTGYLLQTVHGEYKSNPIFSMHNANKLAFLRLLQEYGMTPVSRMRVSSLKGDGNGKKAKKDKDYFD